MFQPTLFSDTQLFSNTVAIRLFILSKKLMSRRKYFPLSLLTVIRSKSSSTSTGEC